MIFILLISGAYIQDDFFGGFVEGVRIPDKGIFYGLIFGGLITGRDFAFQKKKNKFPSSDKSLFWSSFFLYLTSYLRLFLHWNTPNDCFLLWNAILKLVLIYNTTFKIIFIWKTGFKKPMGLYPGFSHVFETSFSDKNYLKSSVLD